MKTILLPIGPPGAGKSTLCNGLQQFMRAVARPCSVANLDPANDNIPYEVVFDVRELVNVEEVMEREELGPNGGVLWAMEEVEANLDWLEERLEDCEETIILDPPGQPELTTHHTALPQILQRLERIGYRIVVIQLLDSVVLTRPSLYLSSLILCLRGPLHLPYPIVNVLTKIDNLKSVGGADLPFNLDFYTEVQDLHHLLPALSQELAASSAESDFKPGHARHDTALIHGLSSKEVQKLSETCIEAKAKAYCPYSHFRVGCSLLLANGSIIQGANVENAAYPVGTCAERVTIATAVCQGAQKGDIRAIAVATDISPPASPCGMCRQFIREFCEQNMPILMYDKDGKSVVMTLEQLLPLSFGPEKLLSTEELAHAAQ